MYFLLCFSVTQCISRFEGNLEDVDLVLASANTKKATMQKKTLMKAESNSAALLQCASKHSYFFFFYSYSTSTTPWSHSRAVSIADKQLSSRVWNSRNNRRQLTTVVFVVFIINNHANNTLSYLDKEKCF